jgi:hypothetical protein
MIPVNVSPKIGRRVDSPSSRSSTRNETNISISNIVRTIPSQITQNEPAILGTTPDNGVVDSLTEIQVPDPLKTSDNIELRRFRQNQDVLDVVVDVRFLKLVIKTLITNHNITTTPHDLECILSHYGDVEIKSDKQVVQHRGVKRTGLCTNVDSDEVIDIIQKILVNGVNIIRKVPDFVQFLSELGLSI